MASRLAMAHHLVFSGWPVSMAQAPRSTISRAASSWVAMSASLNWVFWKSPIGRPNCLRLATYSCADSRARRAPPSEQAAMFRRPPSSPIMA